LEGWGHKLKNIDLRFNLSAFKTSLTSDLFRFSVEENDFF